MIERRPMTLNQKLLVALLIIVLIAIMISPYTLLRQSRIKKAVDKKIEIRSKDVNAIANKGEIYKLQGKLDKAEYCYQRVLELGQQSNNMRTQAAGLGNLGLIYHMRGELDKAEEMYKKSLEIEKKLGRLEGMARQHGNLGLIYKKRSDNKKAMEYWEKALELFKEIGMKPEVKQVERLIEGIEDR